MLTRALGTRSECAINPGKRGPGLGAPGDNHVQRRPRDSEQVKSLPTDFTSRHVIALYFKLVQLDATKLIKLVRMLSRGILATQTLFAGASI